MLLHELVADDVLAVEDARTRCRDAAQHLAAPSTRPERWSRGRSICVTSPVTTILRAEAEARQEHLHLLGRGVLRLVEDDERVVERAAAHERERRDLDDALLQVRWPRARRRACRRARRTAAAGTGRPWPSRSPGRKPSRSPASTAGPREDDARDLAVVERGDRQRHRQVRLAGAGRADAERDGRGADGVDVALLVDASSARSACRAAARRRRAGCRPRARPRPARR